MLFATFFFFNLDLAILNDDWYGNAIFDYAKVDFVFLAMTGNEVSLLS